MDILFPVLPTDTTPWIVDTNIYLDTLLISKDSIATNLIMSRIVELNGIHTSETYTLELDSLTYMISGYNLYGGIYGDSLFVHYSKEQGLPHNEFRGRK